MQIRHRHPAAVAGNHNPVIVGRLGGQVVRDPLARRFAAAAAQNPRPVFKFLLIMHAIQHALAEIAAAHLD